MGLTAFPVVARGVDLTIRKTQTDITLMRDFEPGAIGAFKNPTTGQWALVRAIRNGAGLVNQGDVMVGDQASLADYSVIQSATTDGHQPYFRGIACSSMATNAYGWMYIAGYVEKVNISQSVVTGEMLSMSASVAGNLTNDRASSAWNATLGTSINATVPWPIAIANGSSATGVSSVQLLRMSW